MYQVKWQFKYHVEPQTEEFETQREAEHCVRRLVENAERMDISAIIPPHIVTEPHNGGKEL